MELGLGLNKLNKDQLDVYNECIEKKSGGLCLNLGAGKTLTSLVVALNLSKNKPILVVCSKTLLSSWKNEIHKFFGETLKYIVYHSSNKDINFASYELNEETKVILTTPEVLTKFYKECDIQNRFVSIFRGFGEDSYHLYNKPVKPFIKIGNFLYTTEWGCMIVDEAQNYTNINSMRCKAIASICSKNRWVTSATLFDEPKIERILGYYLIINHLTFPRTLPLAKELVMSNKFKGTKETLVIRKVNNAFIKPKVNEYTINNELTEDEEKVYMSMKVVLKNFQEKVKAAKIAHRNEDARRYSSYLLAMLIYLRQCVVSPMLPISKVFLDMIDLKNKSELCTIVSQEIKKCNLQDYLNDPKNILSSRIKKVIEVVNSRKNEKIVIFTCFRSCLDVIKHFLPKDRNVYSISSSDSIQKRGETIEQFGKKNGDIIILTFEIGAEGLNLQAGNTLLLVDFYWNNGKTQQACGRIIRAGQQAKEVNIYYFTSNTAIEKAIFEKQNQKLVILDEMFTGQIKSKITRIKTDDVIKMITSEENNKIMKKLN